MQAVRDREEWSLRGLGVIAFAHGLSDFYSGIVPFVIFYVVTRAGLSPATQGALGFLWYLTSSLVQPVFGAYSDRRGRWWFLPGSVILTIVFVSLAGVTHSVVTLALCIVIGGFGSAIMHPEAGKYSAMLSGSRKAGGISIFQIGGQVGYAAGPAIVAVLLARFGGAGTLLLLPPGLVLSIGLLIAMRSVHGRAASAHRAATANLADVTVDRTGIALLVISTGLRYFTNAAFMTYLPNLLVGRGVALVTAGQIVSAFLLVSSVGLFAGGYFGDRFGKIRVSIVSLCCAAPCFAAFVLIGGPLGIAFLLAGSVVLAMQNAPGIALVQAMLPRSLGTALGLMNGVAFGAGSACVALAGLAVGRFGAGATLAQIAYVPILAALPFALVAVRRRATLRASAGA